MNAHHHLHHDLAKAEIASRLSHARYAEHVRAARQATPRHRFALSHAWLRSPR